MENRYTCEGKYVFKGKLMGFIFSERGTDVMLDVTYKDAHKLILRNYVRNMYEDTEGQLCGSNGDLLQFKEYDCAVYGMMGNAERPAVCWYCLSTSGRRCFFRPMKCALKISNSEKTWQGRTISDKFKIIIPPEDWEG